MKKSQMLVVALTLSVAALSVAFAGTGETEEPKQKERAVKLTVNDLPPAVKATLQEQVGDGKIVEVKQKTKKGRVVFHADVLTNGKDWEVDVAADGTLLKSKSDKCVDDCNDAPEKPCKVVCGGVPKETCKDVCDAATIKRCKEDGKVGAGKP